MKSKCGDYLQHCMCGNGGGGKFARTTEEIEASHRASLKRARKSGWSAMAASHFKRLPFYHDLCMLIAERSPEDRAA